MKKRYIILLSLMIIFLLPFSAYAADPNDIPGNETFSADPATGAFPSDGPGISGTSAIVMDIDTGDILFMQDPHKKAEPASTTKLMTALLAVEKLNPEDEIEVTQSIYSNLIEDAVTIGLIPGEKITTRDMLYGMLLPSANDAANAIGEGVAGSIKAFVEMMNQKAAELGCKDTHFANTNGLPDSDHYTTVYDMALIACEAYRNARIREVIATPSYWMSATNLSDKRELWTTNELLYDVTDLYYEYCTGGKTGYTGDAGYTMVAFAEKDGRRLVSVVFGCPTSFQRFQDAASLLDYGLREYHILQPLKGFTIDTESTLANVISENFYTALSHALPSYTVDGSLRFYTRSSVSSDDISKRVQLDGAIVNGVVGRVQLLYNGRALTEVPVRLEESQLAPGKDSMIMSLDGTVATEDPQNNGQNKNEILGSTLKSYGIPILLAILATIGILFLFLMLRKYQAQKRVRVRRYMGDRPQTAPVKKQKRTAYYDDDTPPVRRNGTEYARNKRRPDRTSDTLERHERITDRDRMTETRDIRQHASGSRNTEYRYREDSRPQKNRSGISDERTIRDDRQRSSRQGNYEGRPIREDRQQSNRTGYSEGRPIREDRQQSNRTGYSEGRPIREDRQRSNRTGYSEGRPIREDRQRSNRPRDTRERPGQKRPDSRQEVTGTRPKRNISERGTDEQRRS